MRCSKLLIVYGIFYIFSLAFLMHERFLVNAAMKETGKIEEALNLAADAAAETFKAAVYENGVRVMTESVFSYVYESIYYGDVSEKTEAGGKIIFLNGRGEVMKDSDFSKLKKGDELMICFELPEIGLRLPGRSVTVSKSVERLVTLD